MLKRDISIPINHDCQCVVVKEDCQCVVVKEDCQCVVVKEDCQGVVVKEDCQCVVVKEDCQCVVVKELHTDGKGACARRKKWECSSQCKPITDTEVLTLKAAFDSPSGMP